MATAIVGKKLYIHYAVMLALAFLFRFIPPIGPLTPLGMAIIGTFAAAIYGWCTVGMFEPSIIALLSLATVIGINDLALGAFGNTTVLGMLFIFMILGVVNEVGAVGWAIDKLLRCKAFLGKPWLTIWFLLFVCFVLGNFGAPLMIIICLEFIITIFKKAGIQPFTKLGTLIIIGVVYTISMGQVVFPYMGQAIIFVNVYQALTQTVVNYAKFILFAMPLGTAMTIVYVLVMRFVFRADATPLKVLSPETMGEAKPITSTQKKALICFLSMIAFNLCGSIPLLGPLYQASAALTFFGVDLVFIIIMLLLRREDGTSLFQPRTAVKGVMWEMILMTAYIQAMSNYMSAPETGISAAIGALLQPLTQLSPYVFIIGILVATTIITNFANNMVLTIVVMPFIIAFFNQIGMSPEGTMYLLFMTCQMAIITPGGSVMAAAAFSRTDYVKASDMMKLGCKVLPIILFFDLLIGLPYAALLF